MTILTLIKATKIAQRVALRSEMKYKLGSVLFDNTRYVTGWNRGFGVTVQSHKKKWSIHAEEMCLLKGERVGIDFSNSTLVIVRVNRSGELRISKPCESCVRMIERFGVKTIWYVG